MATWRPGFVHPGSSGFFLSVEVNVLFLLVITTTTTTTTTLSVLRLFHSLFQNEFSTALAFPVSLLYGHPVAAGNELTG
jgi:hypothetical protein